MGSYGNRQLIAFALLAWMLLLALPSSTMAAEKRPTEYTVKAVLVFKLSQWITWPEEAFEEPDSPFVVGVMLLDDGDQVLSDFVETFPKKLPDERPVEFRKVVDVNELPGCHMLFFPKFLSAAKAKEAVRHVAEKPVLTVGEIDGFANWGGIMNFYNVGKRIKLEINPEAAKRSGLKVNTRLLQLARIVGED